MNHADEFRRCLDEVDVAGVRALWAHVSPHLPQPENDEQALVTLHRARTEASSIAFAKRAYSHAFLVERGLPSGLPDHLKPKAERLYPRVVSAVGISVNFRAPELRPAGVIVAKAMADAVEDAYADGRDDPTFVRARMAEARAKTMRQLFGLPMRASQE